MTPALQAIHDSPVVQVLSKLGGALPTPFVETFDFVVFRPEMFVKVAAS